MVRLYHSYSNIMDIMWFDFQLHNFFLFVLTTLHAKPSCKTWKFMRITFFILKVQTEEEDEKRKLVFVCEEENQV